ncbi:MAG: 50S ribosomal protein L18e [Nanoarchaeota archaeon]|nr:50S ribosomal protein L18e [Nanoarchaeota archaeon]
MVKSKTKISKQESKKRNSELVETIRYAKSHKEWMGVASALSNPRRKRPSINLDSIEKKAGEEMLVVPGKVLSQGEIKKKVKVAALGFSENAREKLKTAGCEVLSIIEAIKLNPKADKIKIISEK